jgi:DNA-binding protein HU-beta
VFNPLFQGFWGFNFFCNARYGRNRFTDSLEEKPMAKAAAKKTAAAKAPAKAPAKAKTETITLRQLAASLSETHELSKKQANAMLDDMVALITKHLKKGARIRIGGLGILQVRKRAARMGRNPATGEAIKIKASKKVAFRAAKELKEAV